MLVEMLGWGGCGGCWPLLPGQGGRGLLLLLGGRLLHRRGLLLLGGRLLDRQARKQLCKHAFLGRNPVIQAFDLLLKMGRAPIRWGQDLIHGLLLLLLILLVLVLLSQGR